MGRFLKFQTVQAFEKHLSQAFPGHPSPVYLVVSPFDYERRRLMEQAAAAFPYSLQKPLNFSLVLELLETRSFFGTALLFFDGVDKLKKVELEALTKYLERPSSFAYLILGSSKSCEALYQAGKKELVLLDLTQEKPWEREKRLLAWLVSESRKNQKNLSPEAAHYLLQSVGPDRAFLEQELNKLFCYVGARPEIALKDIQAIGSSDRTETVWQIAEALVWRGVRIPDEFAADFGLVAQVRYHLQVGAELSEGSSSLAKSYMVEKYAPIAERHGFSYYRRALLALFELELHLKNQTLEPLIYWDRLYYDLVAIAQPSR